MAVEIPVVIDIDKAFKDAAKNVKTASAPLRSSIDALNAEISKDIQILNMTNVNDELFEQAAKSIQKNTQALELYNDQLAKYSSNAGSIKRMNAELESLNRRWDEMGSKQKFKKNGDLSKDAQKMVQQYRDIALQVQKTGQSLAQIVAQEERLNTAKQRGLQTKRYEDAIMNSSVKTMRVLQEQERILSDRLARTPIGTGKYETIRQQLQSVRKEMELAGKTSADTMREMASGAEKTNSKFESLIKNAVRLAGLHYMSRFIQNVRNVTAELELQRVALGSILQDASKANTLFAQIKEAALQSPFEIKDLISYTKQLAAYRIETDKLFDTTKRLADVSAGLGVDMQRLILAYGQVRAAAVLRGQELRQFTEAGIPLVGLLADKFTELKGRVVSAAEVFDLISKRAVPFSMISEIFEDMTNAGGIFYEMQLKQSETLKGQWMKLKDAVTIMYDEIGNTDVVNEGMKQTLQWLLSMTRNWRSLASSVMSVAVAYGAFKTAKFFMLDLSRSTDLMTKSLKLHSQQLRANNYAQMTGAKYYVRTAAQLEKLSKMYELAAGAGTRWQQITARIKIGMTQLQGAIIGVALGAIALLIDKIFLAKSAADRLRESIAQTRAQGSTDWAVAQRNFKRLADEAVNAADGSQRQRDALRELKQTYEDIIPKQDLEIERLRELKGNYDALTEAIRQNIEKQIHEQNVRNISTTYGETIGTETRAIEKGLKEHFKFSADEARRFVKAISKEFEDGLLKDFNYPFEGYADFFVGTAYNDLKKLAKEYRTTLAPVLEQISEIYGLPKLSEDAVEAMSLWKSVTGVPHFLQLLRAVKDQYAAINEETDYFNKQAPEMGKFAKYFDEMREKIEKGLTIKAKKGTYEYSKEVTQQSLAAIKDALNEGLLSAGISVEDLLGSDILDFDSLEEKVKEGTKNSKVGPVLKNFVRNIRAEYEKLVPPDPLVGIIRNKFEEIASATGASMDDMQRYLKSGEQDIKTYVKELGESLEAEKLTLQKYEFSNEEKPGSYADDIVIQQKTLVSALEEAYKWLERFQKSADKKANKSALSFLKEDLKNVQEIYKRYKEFLEYMDKESAQKKIREIYGNVTAIDFLDPDSYKTRLTSILNQIKALMGQVRKYSTVVTKDMFNDIKASIKKNEGFASKAYKLPGEKGYTIGYGFYDTLPDGRKVTEDMEITMEEADSLLEKHIKRYSALVDTALAKYGKGLVLTEKQYNVLVDLAYQGPKVMEDAIKTAEGDVNKLAEVLKTAASLKVAPELKDAVQMRDMRRYVAFMASMVTDSEEAQEAIVQAFTEAYRIVQDVDFTTVKDNLDRELKRISSEIKHSEAARNFYKNIFDATGDQELATSMTVDVYGNLGEDLNDQIKEQLMTTFVVDLDLLPSDKSIEDLQAAMDALDWSKLASYMPYVKKAYQNAAKEILESGTKTSVKQMETLAKELAKAKSYADKRVEIATKTAQRLREIDEYGIPQSQKEKLREQALEKQAKDIAKLEYEAFKDTPLYTEMFENLDAVSSQTLQRMHDELVRLKGAWKDLDPTQLKEIQSRLDAIDKVAATRNPFGTLAKGFKELIKAGFGKSSQLDKDAADAAERVTRARVAQAAALEAYTKAQDEYNKIVAKSGSTSPEAKAAEQRLNAARTTLDVQTRNLKVAEELAKKAEQEKADYADILRSISNGVAGLLEFNEHVQDAGEGALSIMEAFGSSAESIEMISTMLGGLNDTISGISSTAVGFSQLLSGNIISGASYIAKGIGGLFKGITNIFYAGRVKRANKEIKKQEKILISLQEAYKDLDRAIAKAFGNEYIYNYNQQLKNLQAQAAAYQKQAAAERSKGKKKDKSKIESYEQSYRDTLNEIKDMQYQMAEYFAGTDITSAAEAFADAWLEAYKEFGNTTDAIKEKMQDMVESIVKRAALAGVVQAVLQPWYNELAQIEQWDPGTVAAMINKAYELVPTITAGLGSEAAALQAAGVNLRDTVGDFKGISRDIAGASEESILALAAGINTQNFYMSYMPIINENVAAIRAALTGEAVGAQAPSLVQSNNDLVLQYMSVLPNMDANIAELLAIARKVVEPRGTNSSSHVVAVRM